MGEQQRAVPASVERSVERYLRIVDRLLPGWVVGLYLVGSVALGSYVDGRSDIDLVAVVDGGLPPGGRRRLRSVQAASGAATAGTALWRGRPAATGTCNGVFVSAADLATPVTRLVPVAAHIGHTLRVGAAGSDVSPVAWKVLAERGIAVRGPEPSTLPLDPEPERLRSWNLDNLERYWRPWAEANRRAPGSWFRLRPRFSTAWGMLGPPRLHCTVTTGEVISKEAAGEYALDTFPARWHDLIVDALAYRRRQPAVPGLGADDRRRRTAEFVLDVVADAHRRAVAPPSVPPPPR